MAWFLVTFEEAKREAKIELEKIKQQEEQPESFQDPNQYDMNKPHSRQGTVEPRTIFFMSMLIFNAISILLTQCCCKSEVLKSTYLERTGQDIEEQIFNCNTPENHPNWQRRYGNQQGSSSKLVFGVQCFVFAFNLTHNGPLLKVFSHRLRRDLPDKVQAGGQKLRSLLLYV